MIVSDGALLPPGARDGGVVHTYLGAGGRALRYRAVEAARPRHRLLYLHGIESHGTWFLPTAERLAAAGCTTYLLDRRGSGLNRAPAPGDARSARELLDDVRAMRAHLATPLLHLVGLSWGGKLATAVALDQPDGLGSLTLITPGLCPRVDLSLPQKLAVLAGRAFGGANLVRLPIAPEMFTTDAALLEFIRADPWRLHAATGRLLWASRALDRMVRARLRVLDLPVLLFLAERDRIIDNTRVADLLAALPQGRLRTHRYAGATHSIQLDEPDRLARDIAAFLDDAASTPR